MQTLSSESLYLPPEIWKKIVLFVKSKSTLKSLSLVNRTFHDIYSTALPVGICTCESRKCETCEASSY